MNTDEQPQSSGIGIDKILSRFLPLMDLSILLLGFFIVLLTFARFNEAVENAEQRATKSLLRERIEGKLAVIPLYASCDNKEGREPGKCYVIDENDFSIGEEVDMNSPAKIDELIKKTGKKKENTIICIFSEKYAWDAAFPKQMAENLKKIWKHDRVYRVLNVDLPRQVNHTNYESNSN